MMHVTKRNNKLELVSFDKIAQRLSKLAEGLDPCICATEVSRRVIAGIYDGVGTAQIDVLAAQTAADMCVWHPDYAKLGGRVLVSNLHKQTVKSFWKTVKRLSEHTVDGNPAPLVSSDFTHTVRKNAAKLDQAIDYDRDLDYDYFGFRTLERSYLLRIDGRVVERPQHMLMRVAIGIHGEDVSEAIQTYELMSQGFFTHATPTLFHAGTPNPQMSSCFLMQIQSDSISGIFKTITDCALVSKHAGGIGISVSEVRATGTYIKGTGGVSNGLVPMLRVFDSTARYVDQGGNRRKGSFAVYLEPWHADIEAFLDLKKNSGKDELRARDLFYGLWICDLFMQRVESDAEWTLMCPHECPGLTDAFGSAFEELYTNYELSGRGKRVVKARDTWFRIIESQIETGTPYMLYKDSCCRKDNQQHLGVLKCSNLCTEILQHVSPGEIAVCNLASLALPKFVTPDGGFNFDELRRVTGVVARNLNKLIDGNFYPLVEAKDSNAAHRPIGIGVQGLADTFAIMRIAFDSPEAKKLNREIFENIYHGALSASCELAESQGYYSSYVGSQAHKGILQHDMWSDAKTSLDWGPLREKIAKHGLRNSLMVAPMPTASTAHILGNNEAFEPFTSNIFTRRVLAGEFMIVNKHLVTELCTRGLWTHDLRNAIVANDGSVQNVEGIPPDVQAVYKTAFEISQRVIIDMAADRGAFVDQSQSLNLFVDNASFTKMSSIHFHAWRSGLKTGQYYMRSKPATKAIAVTLAPQQSVDAACPRKIVAESESDVAAGCEACSA